jgi:hypothetical protein
MQNLTVCKVYAKMRELAEREQSSAATVNIPTLAMAFGSTESIIMEYVQALSILDYIKGVDGDRVILS